MHCFCLLQEPRSNLVKEEKTPHSPVMPPSPFSPVVRQDTIKPDNKHSEWLSDPQNAVNKAAMSTAILFVFIPTQIHSGASFFCCKNTLWVESLRIKSTLFQNLGTFWKMSKLLIKGSTFIISLFMPFIGLDVKPLDGSRPFPRLPDSPAQPCSQQDLKIKQEPKTPIAPKKTQVCTWLI